jgi:hypothetical protein
MTTVVGEGCPEAVPSHGGGRRVPEARSPVALRVLIAGDRHPGEREEREEEHRWKETREMAEEAIHQGDGEQEGDVKKAWGEDLASWEELEEGHESQGRQHYQGGADGAVPVDKEDEHPKGGEEEEGDLDPRETLQFIAGRDVPWHEAEAYGLGSSLQAD